MVNKILDSVTIQLGKTFGTDYRYYVENVKQDLQTPCFTVDMLQPLERSRSPVLYNRTMPVVIHYFNDSQETLKKDCYAIAEQVIECLEYLPVDNTFIRGENLRWLMVDDVLEIFITYRFITKRVTEEAEAMFAIEEVGVKTPWVEPPAYTKGVLGVGKLGYMILGKR